MNTIEVKTIWQDFNELLNIYAPAHWVRDAELDADQTAVFYCNPKPRQMRVIRFMRISDEQIAKHEIIPIHLFAEPTGAHVAVRVELFRYDPKRNGYGHPGLEMQIILPCHDVAPNKLIHIINSIK